MIRRSALVAFWLLVAAITFVTLSPIQFRPRTGHAVLERFGAFFALGAAFMTAYPKRLPTAVGVVSLIAVALEAMQRLVPSRHGEVLDALEKLAGGLAGVAVAALAFGLSERFRRDGRPTAGDESAP
ncbi:MAG: VanZ family protein [Pseudomonadota bacterium]|nr:VanZ family protein [Pseudomonadota bacterium]